MATSETRGSTRLRLSPKTSPRRWRAPAGCTLVVRLAAALAEFVERGLEAARGFLGRAVAPIVQEIDGGLRRSHVLVNGDHIDAVPTERLQYRRDLVREHGHVARDGCVLIRTDECDPGVQAHSRIDGGAHFL